MHVAICSSGLHRDARTLAFIVYHSVLCSYLYVCTTDPVIPLFSFRFRLIFLLSFKQHIAN